MCSFMFLKFKIYISLHWINISWTVKRLLSTTRKIFSPTLKKSKNKKTLVNLRNQWVK